MKAFEFIYYCIYCVVLSIKDIREKQEKLTTELYYVPLFFNSLMILFPFLVILSNRISYSYSLSAIVTLSIFFGWIFFCKTYFIKNNNCERIIQFYKLKISNKNAAIIGVLYIILSFVLFCLSSIWTDKIVWRI